MSDNDLDLDFSQYDISDEARAKIESDYAENIKGLKTKISETNQKNAALKADSEKIALDAAMTEENAKVALAEKENDVVQYKAALTKRDERMKAVEQEFADKEKARAEADQALKLDMSVKEFVLGSSVGDIGSNLALEKAYRDSIQVVDGEIVPVDATKNMKEITRAIVQDDAYAKYVKADVGSGAGAAGSNSNDAPLGGSDRASKMKAAKETKDLGGFLDAALKPTN